MKVPLSPALLGVQHVAEHLVIVSGWSAQHQPGSQAVDIAGTSSSHPATSDAKLASQASCPPSDGDYKRRFQRNGKIDGLDHYDWHDMLRTTSSSV